MSKFAAMSLAVNTPQRMVIMHPVTRVPLRMPDGEEAHIMLLSADSDAAIKATRAQNDRRLKQRGVRSSEAIESDVIDFYAALTTSWKLATLDGEAFDVPCNPENARELYSTLIWLREQIDLFVGDRGNFLRAQSTN